MNDKKLASEGVMGDTINKIGYELIISEAEWQFPNKGLLYYSL